MSTAPTESQAEAIETITPLRQQTIPKLSERAIGRMTYQVGIGDSQTVYLAVTGNEGGGYFSREWVALPRIRSTLADQFEAGEPFSTPVLRGAYTNRSVNNGGFLAAMLRHEGLLKAAEPPHLHLGTDGWEAWEREQQQRFAEGERVDLPSPDDTITPPKKLARARKPKATSPDAA